MHPNLPALNVSHLNTFRCVMEAGGYAAAAGHLQTSVPTIWQHVQSLEKLYGIKLFEKQGRQVKPTSAAQRLLNQLDPILEQLDSTFAVAVESDDRPIRLVTGVRMLLEDLVEPLAAFKLNYPNRLVLRHGNDRRAVDLLMSAEADMALALEPEPSQQATGIHYEPAYSVNFYSVCCRKHPYAKTKSSSLRELSRHPLVVTVEGSHGRRALDTAFHHAGLRPNIVVETDNSAFTIACAKAGMGVGILAGSQRSELSGNMILKSLRRQLGQRRIVFMWRKGRILTDPMVSLVETIQQ